MIMELDDEEVTAVNKIRSRREKVAVEAAMQALCTHPSREYSGHSHNDSAYECTICKHIEWR